MKFPGGRYLKAAALHPVSVTGLAVGAGWFVAGGGVAPLLIAGGLELVWLGMLAGDARFRRAVDARAAGRLRREEQRRVENLLAELAPNQREHYLSLRALADRIEANYRRLPGDGPAALESREKVDALLHAFLRLLVTWNDHRRYLGATDRVAIERDLAQLREGLAVGGGETVQEIKRKRIEILEKRLERFRSAEEGREAIAHQLASIEDVLRLVHEGSITLRDPAAITRQLDALTLEVEATEATVREMDRFFGFAVEAGVLLEAPKPAPSGRPRA
jgi:hypothetical protein